MLRLVALLGLLLPTAAVAVTLRVPADFPTIQDAVTAAGTGDVVLVSKGSYAPFVVDGKTGVTVKGKGKPVVDAAGMGTRAVVVQNSSGIVLEGLVLRSPDAVDEADGILVTDSTGVTIRKCTIENVFSDGIRSWTSSGLLVEKCTIVGTGSDGIDTAVEDLLGPTTASTFLKNKLIDIGDDGLDLEGPGHTVEKNRFENVTNDGIVTSEDAADLVVVGNKFDGVGDEAMRLRGDDCRVEKNKMVGVVDDVIDLRAGDRCLVVSNKIKGGAEGIRVRGDGHRVEKNKIADTTDDGIDIEATNCELVGNKIKNPDVHGINIGSDENPTNGNLVEGNKIKGAREDGVHVGTATDNVFRRNTAKKSGGFDLRDEQAAGVNTYEDNKFGTESIGGS